ncbi:MAG: hypothetical protein QXL14_01960 [Candidatus Aenigmatarchaeota archaeon]
MKKQLLILISPLILFLVIINYSYALTVGPAKIEFTANPGDVLDFNLFIRNDSDWDSKFYITVEGFTDVGGERKFFENPPEKDWVNVQKEFSLKAKEDIQIPVKINIPQAAPPGGHFLAIWVGSGAPKTEAGQVGIIARVGALVFINVRGNAIYKATIAKFDAKRIVWDFPVKFAYLIKNEGNTYITPRGYIDIKNIFGKEVASLPINPKELQILPNAERLLETEWQGKFAFGIYKAIFNMNYGENNSLNFNYWFIFLNIYYIAVIVALIIFVVFVLPILIRKYNAYIIRKYTQKHE